MKKYIVELSEDAKDKIEKFSKAFDLDVCFSEAGQLAQEEEKWPRNDDIYCFIDSDGEILTDHFNLGSPFCKYLLSVGNCFKTEEEAKFEVERLKVITEMKKFEEPKDRKWDGANDHFIVTADASGEHINYYSYVNKQYHCIFFESLEKAQECVQAVGQDRIKKYYLRTED